MSRKACGAHYYSSPALAGLLRRRPLPGISRTSRNTTPVVWNDVTNFWALTEIRGHSLRFGPPAKFTSTKGITIPDPAQPEPVQEGNLIFTDPPRHRQLRKLINSGFTRRQVTLLEPKVREIVRGIVDDIDPSEDPAVRRRHRLAAAHPH